MCNEKVKMMTTKTKTKTKSQERKPNWKEVYASVEDIQQFLTDRVLMRYNLVTHQTEVHWLTDFGDDLQKVPQWERINDRIENTLWKELSKEKPVRMRDLQYVIGSDYVPAYHPFRFYLEHLPPWAEEQGDNIMELSLTVNVRGDSDEQILFYQYLKKWLVAMVASWMDDRVVNNVMLVLIGEQGAYKTTWFSHLLPPQLREYFYTKTNSGMVSKDDLLTLSQYGLMCWEELDSMQLKELNKLKAVMTMPSINERAAYAHYHENRPHLASFCGTGNNVQFLSDPTGTRRWLPFEVESIESPLTSPFNYEGIYSQAYALYRQGFRYWFDRNEILRLSQHNQQFETANLEMELVTQYFRKPEGNEPGEFISVAMALQIVGANITQKLSTIMLGRAFVESGFEKKTVHNIRGYVVVRRSAEEMRSMRYQMANTDTDNTPVF
jgi:predicted P-loop ATPase